MAEDKVSLPFKFEYAVSGRSSCKSSGEPIPVGTARVGIPNPQHQGSFSWFLPRYSISEVKQPKTKNGLKCKICAEKVFHDIIVVGKGGKSTSVCGPCFKKSISELQFDSRNDFLFTGDFNEIEGFKNLPDDRKNAFGKNIAGDSFDLSKVTSKKRKSEVTTIDDITTATSSSSVSVPVSPPKKVKKVKAEVQCITEKTPLVPKKLCDGKTYFKVISWNVAGLRAVHNKDPDAFQKLLASTDADMLCIQEHKLQEVHIEGTGKAKKGKAEAIDTFVEKGFRGFLEAQGYSDHWAVSTTKKGYSGVAVFLKRDSKFFTDNVQIGDIGISAADDEGRVITVKFDDFVVTTTYVPNSGRNLERLDWRTETWDKALLRFMQEQELGKKKPVVLCGDLNVAHKSRDVYNEGAAHNFKQAGLTVQERNSFSQQLDAGFVDAFRHLYPEHEGHYSYWSNMAGQRAPNKGLRLDYFICSEQMAQEENKVTIFDSYMMDEISGSDHGPVVLVLEVQGGSVPTKAN